MKEIPHLFQFRIWQKHLGIDAQWYVKFEGLNPTGSFKDRGMCMAVTKAKEAGMKTVICASTGNTSASAAAYAAKANMDCIVLIPKGKIALGKLSQAMMHGARVIQINGNFDVALNIVREIAEKEPIALVNSVNPYRIEGQKTGAFEIVDQLGTAAPDYHFMPVGNAGNITAYWKGYKEYLDLGKIDALPKMVGFQAEGAAPIVRAMWLRIQIQLLRLFELEILQVGSLQKRSSEMSLRGTLVWCLMN